jgi:hypothetical protein
MCCNVFQVFHVFFASVLDACFDCFIYLQAYVASVVSGCFKRRSDVASPSSPSSASPWCLLTFCYLASFSDCGGGTVGAGGGGALRDGSAHASARSALLLRGQVALRCLLFLLCGMLRWVNLLVGHDANPWFIWLSFVQMRCWRRMSRR